MDNIVIPQLYSNIISCTLAYKQDIHDIDSFVDVIAFHLVDAFGDNLAFFISANDLTVRLPSCVWLQDAASTFSAIQKDLVHYIHSPVMLTTGCLPTVHHWEIIIRHGAIETKTKK